MNYWMQRRRRSIDFSFEVTRGNGAGKVVLNEFYLNAVFFDSGGKHLTMNCDYNSNVESTIKKMMTPGIISDHYGELRVYKSGNLRECWALPMMKYINLNMMRWSQKMFFSVTSSALPTIKSDFIRFAA